MLNKLLKNVLEQDKAPVLICDMDFIIVYMNPSSIERYRKDLPGRNLKTCHSKETNKKIDIYVRFDRVLTVKLYPEQGRELRFPQMRGGKLYYCNVHGLLKLKFKQLACINLTIILYLI